MADRTPNPYDAVENPRAFDGYEKGYAACERDMQRGDDTVKEGRSGPITFTDSKGRKQTLQCEQSEHEPGGCLIRPATPDDLTRAGYRRSAIGYWVFAVSTRGAELFGATVVDEGGARTQLIPASALSRIATALGLPETAGEEEIVERCKEAVAAESRYWSGASKRDSLLCKIGEHLAEAIEKRQGASLPAKALEALAERVAYFTGLDYEHGTGRDFVRLLQLEIRPHLLPTLEELKDEVITAYGGPVPGWIAKKLDAIVAAAQREKSR